MILELQHWHDVPRSCGRAVPGRGHDNDRVMDLSARATTPDQQRIESVLSDLLGTGARLLHVGVGNPSLALRFADRAQSILGLTLSDAEKRHGDALAIPGYRIEIVNKYAPQFADVAGPFDFIIDNNPASFGCCVRHFEDMLAHYARILVPGGMLLTDRVGMAWTYGDGPMRLRFEDLETIARSYPFTASRITQDVYALCRKG